MYMQWVPGDKNKEKENVAKHGVDFAFGLRIWNDPCRVERAAMTADGETRTLTFGMVDGKLWLAVWTQRPEGNRPISVHRVRGSYERIYNEQKNRV
jgi:uncharacterized DUF497 family protein